MAIPEKTRIKINVIAFIFLSAGLIYAMATQVLSVLQDRYSVLATFPDAGGVFTNQEVTYRGVTVGQVGSLEVVPQGVEIELLIDQEYKIPEEDVEARIMFKSAVGEQFVDLLPASHTGPYLEHEDKIPLEQTSIPVSTQELLSTLQNVLRGVPPEAVKGAIDALGIGLTGRGPDIARILESTADLADLFATRAPEIESLLRNGTKVGGAFLASQNDFRRAINGLVTVSESLGGSTDELESLLRGTNLSSDEIVALVRENRPQLYDFLRKFAELNELQAQHAGDLNEILSKLPTALYKVVSAFEKETGMIRFGLVTEPDSPACSYGTPRRPPQERTEQRPPKDARCGLGSPGGQRNAAQPAEETSGDAPVLGGLGSGTSTSGNGASLPSRMSGWSWSLFYLNGM
ncbi:MAG: MCE family protein [Actinomycetota bacterium]|nr:MCE family protein [Actinomycetota bacterium]